MGERLPQEFQRQVEMIGFDNEIGLPVWAWLTGAGYLVLDWALIRKLTKWALVNRLKAISAWFMGQLTDQVALKVAPMAVEIIESSLRERMEQMTSERLSELTPEPPPHGITGELCPKTGLYRVQGGGLYLIQRTFEEGQVFPSASTSFGEVGGRPLGKNEEKVVWVYQTPGLEE